MAATYSAKEQKNKEIVVEFYNSICGRWDFDSVAHHLGSRYIQHSTMAGDGAEGLKAFIGNVPPHIAAHLKMEIKRVIVDDDYVVLQVLNTLPGEPSVVIMETFRLEDGKIVEHWDVIQQMPATLPHGNDMV